MEEQAEQQGGERAERSGGGEIRRLERAPGERYADAAAASVGAKAASAAAKTGLAGRRSRLVRAIAAALGAAVVTFALTSFDIGPGLLAVAVAAGWIVGLALAGGGRPVAAGALAAAAMALGLLADGLRALTEGGVLAPWAYAWERFGLLAVAVLLVAGVAGAWRGR